MTKKNPEFRLAWIVRGDIDGFFGLFIDNLMQLMLITVLCRTACGFPTSFITGRILPGVALSILAGNLFYAWQARRLARKTGRRAVTALPFGINTVGLLAFIFLVMAPVYAETGDTHLTWQVGLAACFLSGLIEILGAFFGNWLKKHTPRPALLSGLAGVALSFMTLGFSFQIFSSPTIAILPMVLILIAYGARLKLPLRLPGGLVAIVVGIATAWAMKIFGGVDFSVPEESIAFSWNWPKIAGPELLSILFKSNAWTYVAIVLPIGFFNIISSIENLESAEAAGDRYPVKSSLMVNGVTSLLAGALGSPFPTTIYIGHPGWKAMGARSGYSALNGLAITLLCLIGGITALLNVVPIEVTLGILVWIGLVIVAQSFQEIDRRHMIAVALGLIPPLAAWALHLIETTLHAAGTNLYDAFEQFSGELYIEGILNLYQGFLLTGIILAAIMTHIIDKRFLKAAVWSFGAALFANIGLIHAYQLTPGGIQTAFGWYMAPAFTVVYAVCGIIFILLHFAKLPSFDVE